MTWKESYNSWLGGMELDAIKYQKEHKSWDKMSPAFRKAVQEYKKINQKLKDTGKKE